MLNIVRRDHGTALLDCSIADLKKLRHLYSVKNENFRFQKQRGNFWAQERLYCITEGGCVDTGLVPSVIKACQSLGIDHRCEPDILRDICPGIVTHINGSENGYRLKLTLRDYQQDIVDRCIKFGRGTIELATSGGKTLVMASILEYIFQNVDKDFKAVVIVPDIGLVNQTFSDFKEYGSSFTVSKYSGKNELNLDTNVIVANTSILYSKGRDNSWIKDRQFVLVDEVHGVKAGNKINKILQSIKASCKFGFTGSLPKKQNSSSVDYWNIIGKFGPVIYRKDSNELRKEKHVVPVSVIGMILHYQNAPKLVADKEELEANPTKLHKEELDFVMTNEYRAQLIRKLVARLDQNALIMVDRIPHGQFQFDALSDLNDKQVFFIRGEIEVEERNRIQQIMETCNNVVVVAISKIFSTGINIKNLHYLVFAGGGKARTRTIQSIGRGLRLHASKDRLVIFDIVDDLKYGPQHFAERAKIYNEQKVPYSKKHFYEK